MAINFDTLGYSQYLMKNGVEEKQAQALTYAALDYFIPEPATMADLQPTVQTKTLKITIAIGGIITAMLIIAALSIIMK